MHELRCAAAAERGTLLHFLLLRFDDMSADSGTALLLPLASAMKDFLGQVASTAGAAFAAACCAGAGWALAALTAVGAGFLINDAVLIPLFAALLGLSLWLLFGSARAHHDLRPVYVAALGALGALVGLWTSTLVLFAGLGLIVASSLWDYLGTRASR